MPAERTTMRQVREVLRLKFAGVPTREIARRIGVEASERRTIGHDFRRSGAVEAIVGGARAEALSHAMGNTLSASNALFATYVPVNVATLRGVMEARRAGRSKLR
jgi:hypothetical protein